MHEVKEPDLDFFGASFYKPHHTIRDEIAQKENNEAEILASIYQLIH